MTAVAEVLKPGEPTLGELAVTIKREHGLVLESARSTIEHAINVGEALLSAKDACGEGNWLAWLEGNTDIHQTTANWYMRVAYQAEAVRASGEVSFTGAYLYLRQKGLLGPDRPGGRRGQGNSDETRAEARHMHDDLGMSFAAIAGAMGFSYNTVRRWLDPEYRQRWDAHAKAYRAQRRADARQARLEAEAVSRERRIADAARRAGGALAEAYALATRLDGILGKARQDATERDPRIAINEAHAYRDKMMDALIKALGVS
jgi:hypothetical protein